MGEVYWNAGETKIKSFLHNYTFNVLPYERIIHDVTVICLQNLLKFSDVVILIGTLSERERESTYILNFNFLI